MVCAAHSRSRKREGYRAEVPSPQPWESFYSQCLPPWDPCSQCPGANGDLERIVAAKPISSQLDHSRRVSLSPFTCIQPGRKLNAATQEASSISKAHRKKRGHRAFTPTAKLGTDLAHNYSNAPKAREVWRNKGCLSKTYS